MAFHLGAGQPQVLQTGMGSGIGLCPSSSIFTPSLFRSAHVSSEFHFQGWSLPKGGTFGLWEILRILDWCHNSAQVICEGTQAQNSWKTAHGVEGNQTRMGWSPKCPFGERALQVCKSRWDRAGPGSKASVHGDEWELGNTPTLAGSWDRGVVIPNPRDLTRKATGSVPGPAVLGQSRRRLGWGGCVPQQLHTSGSVGRDGSEQAELSGRSWHPCSSMIPQVPLSLGESGNP